jgi:hypothetical protein
MGLGSMFGRRGLGFVGAGLALAAVVCVGGCGTTDNGGNTVTIVYHFTDNPEWDTGAFFNTSDLAVPGTVQLNPVPFGNAIQGTWDTVLDGLQGGAQWQDIFWNQEPEGDEPPGTSIVVQVRVAENVGGLASQPFTIVTNGQALAPLLGRFLEVLVTLNGQSNINTATSGSTEGILFLTPVLSDLTVRLLGAFNIIEFIPFPGAQVPPPEEA